jgi:Zn-dependent protease
MTSFTNFLVATVMLAPALLVAIPVHELGHAAAAYFQGDRSVRYFGYFTLNPRRFLDPIGAIAVFMFLVGWGRKVPVQPNRISTVRQRLVFALGGPAANLIVAILLGLVLRAFNAVGIHAALTPIGLLAFLVYAVVFLNLSVFAFNLLPIPGLDGWDVIETIFRSRNARFFFNVSVRRREVWAGVAIVIFVGYFVGIPVLSIVMEPFFKPASLISVGQCISYGVPRFNYLNPCLL